MRCPKCGESFQVTVPGSSEPSVLGAALGLGASPATVPPQPEASADDPARRAPPPRPRRTSEQRQTMLGVAPASAGLELAEVDDDGVESLDAAELDLPGKVNDEAALPSPIAPRPSASAIDLPSLSSDADLPELGPSPLAHATTEPELAALPDLPSGAAELPAAAELPRAAEQEPALPALSSQAGLPARPVADLPATSGQASAAAGGAADLPDLGADLPDLGGTDLPDLEAGLPLGSDDAFAEEARPFDLGSGPASLDLGPAEGGQTLSGGVPPASAGGQEFSFSEPAPEADDVFGHGPVPAPESLPAGGTAPAFERSAPVDSPRESVSKESFPSAGASFGEVDLSGQSNPSAPAEGGEFDAFPTEVGGAADGDGSAAAEQYGDVSLEGGSGDLDLGADLDRTAADSGGARPLGPAAAASAQVELPTADQPPARSSGRSKKKRRKTTGLSKTARWGLGGLLGVAVVGGGLASLVPAWGPYGAFLIVDTIKADEYQARLDADMDGARKKLEKDTAKELQSAFADLERGRIDAPRFKPRLAFTAYLGYLHQLRFGESGDWGAKARVLLDELADDSASEVAHLGLARLARDAAEGKPASAVAQATRELTKGVEHAVVVGESALRVGNAQVALAAWERVIEKENSARSHFGMARALRLSARPEAEVAVEISAALAANPHHTGARLSQAEGLLKDRAKDEQVRAALTALLAAPQKLSLGERVTALNLLGRLHLRTSRLKKAEKTFSQALSLESASVSALSGLALVLFESGRFSEALARFEAALRADPDNLPASLGVVRSNLRLEKLQDAVKLLDKLAKKHPESSAVSYWVGRGKESIGATDAAQAAYQQAVDKGDASPELVHCYVALTRLLGQKGHGEEAAEVIGQARRRFPDDPEIFGALGELSTSRGMFDEAVEHFAKALELDPNNLGLRFSRAVALRQARRFEQAKAEFDHVEKESPQYPGLALERGNLFEASGQGEKALKSYEAALAIAPDDPDLMLRVACGKAGAGQSKPALELLAPVLSERQNSAEVNFCYGLALLNGGDLHDARRHLQRAVARDPTRARYHLYLGWIALELNELPLAGRSLDEAIKLDQSLADAYWKRGELRVRQKAVRDALVDLERALELAPSRLEAHAQKALAYIELGNEPEAIRSFDLAVAGEGVAPYWAYKYGELLLANRRAKDAKVQLESAVSGAETEEEPPVWLPNAHRLLALAIGPKPEALPHLRKYIDAKQTDRNDPYLREAIREASRIMGAKGF